MFINVSDVGQRGARDQANCQHAWEVVILAAAFVSQVDNVLLLSVIWVTEEGHLTQEGVYNDILIVDLPSSWANQRKVLKQKKELDGEIRKESQEYEYVSTCKFAMPHSVHSVAKPNGVYNLGPGVPTHISVFHSLAHTIQLIG